ncbi:MAG: class I SAM-dependent methyltransferase [Sphingobacteriia bacterium]|nr:class I SAM-dependent methyltransferase [Sphingobacteriia bacterium]
MIAENSSLDPIAGNYHLQDPLGDKHIEAAAQRYTFEWVFSHIPEGSRVLEMGTGEGLFTRELLDRKINAEVVEGSSVLVEHLQKQFPQLTVHSAWFENFVPSTPYDVVLAGHVLEHIINPVELLIHMKSWLAPGGKIIVIVPNKKSLHRQLAVKMGLQPALDTLGMRDQQVGHVRVYGMDTLKADLSSAGFKVSSVTGFFLKVLPNSMMTGFSDSLLKALNEISADLPPEWMANIGCIAEVEEL